MISRIGAEATIELDIRGPLLVHSSSIGPWAVDAAALRDAAGRLVIPGNAVQGKLREAFDQLGGDPVGRSRKKDMSLFRNNADEVSFAELHDQNLQVDPLRYPIFFSDFVTLTAHPPAGERTLSMTSVDENSGAAKQGTLRVLDCPILPGQIVTFQGKLRFFAKNEVEGNAAIEQIIKTLAWVMSFGSQKSIGFGRNVADDGCPNVRLRTKRFQHFDRPPAPQPIVCAREFATIDFTFCDPLCFPAGVVNGNIFESRDEVPGEALRGALAELLKQIDSKRDYTDLSDASAEHPFSMLCQHFDRVRITTARPTAADAKGRVSVVPLSTCIADNRLFDFALSGCDKVFDGVAAKFAPDWKSHEQNAVNEAFGVAAPPTELRVRTAIEEGGQPSAAAPNGESSRSAKMHSLFAYRMVRPKGFVWRATVGIDGRSGGKSLSAKLAAQVLHQCIVLLKSGWLSVGKTRARTTASRVRPGFRVAAPAPYQLDSDLIYIITLRSGALMLDPRDCVDEEGCLQPLHHIDDLYARYWQEVSGGALAEMPERRFKRDGLVGGYQAWKYRYAPTKTDGLGRIDDIGGRIARQKEFPYNPTLVVDVGSVFVLKVVDQDRLSSARDVICEWLAHGLPCPQWAMDAYGDTHHTNIFLPQNGFGEVDVNLPCHQSSYADPWAKLEAEHDVG